MSVITLMRDDQAPPSEKDHSILAHFLTGVIDGFSRDDKTAWRRFLRRLWKMEPGELALIEARIPRSGPFHRRHMKIEQTVFDAQERFVSFEQFRIWLKVGAGWIDWCAGPKGGVVPIPKSVSYAAADDDEFRRFHAAVVEFLRGDHAAIYLWKHLGIDGAAEMMNTILEGFDE